MSFAVRVHPRSRKNGANGTVGDALKVSLTAPPVEGRANEALIEFFANVFGVSRTAIEVVSGALGRNKVVRVRGVTRIEAEKCLYSLLH